MPILAQKNILVTGASRGIGAAIVREAMAEGATVIFTYLNSESEALALAAEMSERYPDQRCSARLCDATDTDATQNLVKKLVEEYGRSDGLGNNAGIARDAILARMTRDQWDHVMNTNLGSLFNATRPLVLQMIKQRGGAIVNISSVVGVYGNPGQTNYAAAKAGIIGFSKSLSAEIAPYNVRVNVVAPGYIRTDMIAFMDQETVDYVKGRISLRRLGSVDDVAPSVCFLLSDKSAYITGQVLQIDGGITL